MGKCGQAVTIKGVLRLGIAQLGDRTHQAAIKLMAGFLAVCGNLHTHRHTRAGFVFAQRAQIIRQSFGQHRHNAVGHVNRIAAFARFDIHLAGRFYIGRDIGNRHPNNIAALIVRVGFGKYRIVMVAGIGRVNGDKGQGGQVFAPCRIGFCHGFGFGHHRIGENSRQTLLGNRDKRKGVRVVCRADIFFQLCAFRPHARAGQFFANQQIAMRRFGIFFKLIVIALAAVGGDKP